MGEKRTLGTALKEDERGRSPARVGLGRGERKEGRVGTGRRGSMAEQDRLGRLLREGCLTGFLGSMLKGGWTS